MFGLKEHSNFKTLYSSQLVLDFINAVALGLRKEFHGLFLEKASANNGRFVDEILKASFALSWIITPKSLCNSWLQNWGFSSRKVLFRFYTHMFSLYKAQEGYVFASCIPSERKHWCVHKMRKSLKIPIFGALKHALICVFFFSCYRQRWLPCVCQERQNGSHDCLTGHLDIFLTFHHLHCHKYPSYPLD